MEPDHDGIERVRVEDKYDTKLGFRSYVHRFDTNELPLDRSFEKEWVDGPVRFRLERHDHADHYLFSAEAAGKVTRMRDGYSDGKFTGGVGGGSQSQRTVVSAAHDGYQEEFDEGDVIYVNTMVDLWHNPLEFRVDYDGESRALAGFSRTLDVELGTPGREDYEVTWAMLKAQVRVLLDHITSSIREAGVSGLVSAFKETLASRGSYHKNSVLSAVLDTAYILNLREATAYATSVEKNGYPVNPDKGAEEKLSPVAEWVGEKAWKLGLIEKPRHVKYQEQLNKHRERRERPPQQQRAAPPKGSQPPSEENNTCSECDGLYHKDDLESEGFEKQGGQLTGTEWFCPDCGAKVGEEADYHGPVPVQTPSGTELH